MPDDPKPAAAPERFQCWACSWDSLWPHAGPGCYCCLRERIRRGHAAGRVVEEDGEKRVITDDDGQPE